MTPVSTATVEPPVATDLPGVPVAGGRRSVILAVPGMHCGACVRRIEAALGVHRVVMRPSLATRTVELEFDPRRSPLTALVDALEQAGFPGRPVAAPAAADLSRQSYARSIRRVVLAAFLTMQVMMLAWPFYLSGGTLEPGVDRLLTFAQWLLATPVVFYAGWPFLSGAWRDVRNATPSMDLPVGLALITAYGFSAWHTVSGAGTVYFDSAVMFVLFLSLGRLLEARGRLQAAERVRHVLVDQPTMARVRDGDGWTEQAVATVVPGMQVQVRPGETVPVDGRLVGGGAHLSQAVLTGEPAPRWFDDDASVLAGSVLVDEAPVTLTATAAGTDTTLAAIGRAMHRALSERPPAQVLADRIAGVFILAVLVGAAAAGWAWWSAGPDRAVEIMLAVLVASCPCALSLAVPAVLAAAIGRLSRLGVLPARARALLAAGRIDTVVFDKTGTLTEDGLVRQVVRVRPGCHAEQALQLAAAVERASTHPIARAFDDIEAAPAHAACVDRGSVSGEVAGLQVVLSTAGSEDLRQLDVEPSPELTWIALRVDGVLEAVFGLAATRRSDALQTVQQLQAMGCHVHLLSGDTPAAANHFAASLGMDAASGGCTPADKLAYLQSLRARGHRVAMVGDGINDSPTLAAADVGIALGSGTGLAQSSADAILMDGRLGGVVDLLRAARTVRRRITQNVVWALGYNAAVYPLAALGYLPPWGAAIGMATSSAWVVANSIRRVPDRTRPATHPSAVAA